MNNYKSGEEREEGTVREIRKKNNRGKATQKNKRTTIEKQRKKKREIGERKEREKRTQAITQASRIIILKERK